MPSKTTTKDMKRARRAWEDPDYSKMTNEQLMWDNFILWGCLEMRKRNPELYEQKKTKKRSKK